MTLIVSSISKQQAIQVSDRRARNHDGTWTDDLNKTFVAVCEDARVIVGFCGLAAAKDFRAIEWVGQAMMQAFKPDLLFEPMLLRFEKLINQKFSELRDTVDDVTRCFTVVFTGYKYSDGTPRAYVWHISNYDALDEDEPSDLASPVFRLTSLRQKIPSEEHFAMVLPSGNHEAVSDKQLERLFKLTMTGSTNNVLKSCVRIVQTAAASKKSQRTISPDCSSTLLPASPSEPAVTDFHSKNRKVVYSPGILVARKQEGVFFMPESAMSSKPFED